MSDERDFFLDDLLGFLYDRFVEFHEDEGLFVSDQDALKDFKYYTVNVPYRDKKLTFYKIVDLNDDFTGLVYCSSEYESFAPNILFAKNCKGVKLCEKIRENDYSYLPRIKTIEEKRVKLMICNDFEGLIECFKNNYLEYSNKKSNKMNKDNDFYEPKSNVVVIKQKVERKKEEKEDLLKELPMVSSQRNSQSILGAINYSISFFEKNFKPKDEGELHLDCKGKKGHHFPSITVTALKVASLYAPFSTYTKTPKKEWLRDLELNINGGENVGSVLKKLYEKKSDLEKQLKD